MSELSFTVSRIKAETPRVRRIKAPHLHLARSAEEIAWMRQLRATVDPDGLLNPGIVLIDPLDDRTRSA